MTSLREWCLKNNPELLNQWNHSKNVDISPDSVGANSHKKAWWIGPCGHEWLGIISNRVTENAGCPICANKQVLAGFNDLASQDSELMLDWDYTKNTTDPKTITKSSKTECFWKCHLCGHEWKASPKTRRGSPCSVCSSVKRISLAEKSIAYYLSKTTEVWENYVPDFLGRQEIDVYLPKFNIGIEYDGGHFHKNVERDLRKNRLCKENGVILIRVRADSLLRLDNCITIDVDESSKDSLDQAIVQLTITLNQLTGERFETDVNILRDINHIREARYTYYVENSFAKNHPECLSEVHPTKNGNLNLEMVSEFSVLRIHWVCSQGHEWTSTISNRASGNGCPYCAGNRVCPGENDLLKLKPKIANEWHPSKNGNLSPDQVAVHSNKKVWWMCEKGHEWQAVVHSRTLGLCGCPFCNDRLLKEGYNDLQTKRPDIAKEWHPNMNGCLTPSDVKFNQDLKVWWKCEKGHEWQAVIGGRTYDNRRCPYCSGRFAVKGATDLSSIDPDLSKDWNYERNSNLTPSDVKPGSDRVVWWRGKCGHEWQSSIFNYRKSRKCPFCTNKRVLPGFNDLDTVDSELAKEWHPTRNGNLTPKDVLPYSNKKIWWLGKCGHEWEAVIGSRHGGRGCPYCAGQKVLSGFNYLVSKRPDLAKQWNYLRNDSKPEEFTIGSGKSVWWKCEKGHEWEALISNRTKGEGCPICFGRRPKNMEHLS